MVLQTRVSAAATTNGTHRISPSGKARIARISERRFTLFPVTADKPPRIGNGTGILTIRTFLNSAILSRSAPWSARFMPVVRTVTRHPRRARYFENFAILMVEPPPTSGGNASVIISTLRFLIPTNTAQPKGCGYPSWVASLRTHAMSYCYDGQYVY